jgi:hypothetical protein
MFIRWKRRDQGTARGGDGRDISYHAVLVRAERVQGQPRQRVVKHLWSIREFELPDPDARARFWRCVAERLGKLGIEADEGIADRLTGLVPRPSAAEMREAARREIDRAARMAAVSGTSYDLS